MSAMSGGAYDYAYRTIRDIEIQGQSTDPRRATFQNLLKLVAEAMHDIEWVDSADSGPGDEHRAIDRVLAFLKHEASQHLQAEVTRLQMENEMLRKSHDVNGEMLDVIISLRQQLLGWSKEQGWTERREAELQAARKVVAASRSYFEGRKKWNTEGYGNHDACIDALGDYDAFMGLVKE